MKYRPAKELCSWASQQLSKSFDLLFPTHDWELIIPLPSSRASLQERLFNQCKEIAYYLKKNIVLPAKLAPLALRHHGDSKPQASLTHKERLKNVANCFKASPKMVYGRSILLVDDVITTGATSTAATIELLKKGASKVDLIALARSDNWQEHRQSVNKFFLSLGIDNEFPRSSAS